LNASSFESSKKEAPNRRKRMSIFKKTAVVLVEVDPIIETTTGHF
jgi:hypothetical protein